MPRIEKPDFKTKKSIPSIIKFVLMIAVILGIWGRSCWRKSEIENFVFTNIVVENQTHVSVEVIFDVNNKTFQTGRKNILIEVFTDQHEMIASRITTIEVSANETRRYVRTIENFLWQLKENETIAYARVGLYQRSAF